MGYKDPFPGTTPREGASFHQLKVLGPNPLLFKLWFSPPYMNCPNPPGGFETDTLCVRRSSRPYDFRIYVQDSLPVFLDSVAADCNGTANLTDSLRFYFDINTDDEIEDSVSAAVSLDVALHDTGSALFT